MSERISDEELAALFARQRAADQERTPGFHAMRSRTLEIHPAAAPGLGAIWRWAFPAAAALALGIAVLITTHRPAPPPERFVREIERIDAALQKNLATRNSLTAWQSPTDFLLNPIRSANP